MPIASPKNTPGRPALMVLYMSEAGLGKTMAALSYPKPLIYDGEGGTRHYMHLFEGAVIRTKSFGEVLRGVREFNNKGKITWKEGSDTLEFSPETIAIDPATSLWESIQAAKFLDSMSRQGLTVQTGTEKPKVEGDNFQAWAAIKLHWNTLLSEAKNSGVNFVCCAHEKEEMIMRKNEFGKLEPVKTGRFIADMEKKYMYVFDLVIRLIWKDSKRVGVVLKTRLKNTDGTDRFTMGQEIPQWDYKFLVGGMDEKVSQPVKEQTETEAVAKDVATVEKDPESLRLSAEIHAKILPKSGISMEDLTLYLINKKDNEGKPIAALSEDGKLHLSTMTPKALRFVVSVLSESVKVMQLVGKINELKKEKK